MVRHKFEMELEELNFDLVNMGGLIEDAIASSIKALISQDKALCDMVIENDREINELTSKIESNALKILLRQQPVAKDLRTISTALKIVTDMERIGDQARDICGIVLHLCDEEYQTQLIKIPQMAEAAKKMVGMCVDSFVRQDIAQAEIVVEMDNEVDELFAKVKDNMINLIHNHPQFADQAIYLMMVAKYFEKIGDHAENIAQWVIFSKTGERKHFKIL